jgi:DNA-binding winged helix-turn-helix (wHTH) protein/tetratricopeptide (TPR) repeat protein
LNETTRSVLCFLTYSLDPANAQLRQGDAVVALRPKTLAVLRYLAERTGRLVTKAELLDAVWPDTTVTEGTLASSIKELRRVLGDDARRPRIIETAHTHGYRFIADVRMLAAGTSKSSASIADRVDRPSSTDARHPRSLPVGRESELAALEGWLQRALGGERQIGFIAGEAGIGKTALVDEFLRRLGANLSSACLVAHGQCLEHHGAREPYLPVLEALERLCAAPEGAEVLPLLRRHAATWLAQLTGLLSAEEAEALQRQLATTTRERMLRDMASLVVALPVPLVIVLEDLHWSDNATIDLVAALAYRRDPAPLLVIGTYRPVDAAVGEHPLRTVHQELRAHGRCRELWLQTLDEDAVAAYLCARLPGLATVKPLAHVIYERTDGNPLFVVNVVDFLLSSGVIAEANGHYAFTGDIAPVGTEIPQGLREMIAIQIERVSETERDVLEAGSVVGRTFSAAAVAAALDADVVDVEACLERLARRAQLVCGAGEGVWPDGTVAGRYEFIHSLYQHVLKDRIRPARRRRLHHRIAIRLEAGYGRKSVEIATELAYHFEAGGEPERGVPYLEDGAARAVLRCANREAAKLLERGLAILDDLPPTPERTLRTIRLCLALGLALQPLAGFAAPDVERPWRRARALSEATDDAPQLFQTLLALTGLYVAKARFDLASEAAEQLVQLTERLPVPGFVFAGHMFDGIVRYHAGDLAVARTQLEQAAAFDEFPLPVNPVDVRVHTLNYLALTLLHQGHPDQALERNRQAATRAAERGSPFDRGQTATIECYLQMFLRDMDALARAAHEALILGDEYGFPIVQAIGKIGRGRVLVAGGDYDAGISALDEGIDAYRITGQAVSLPTLLALLADAHGKAGHLEQALLLVAEARALVESTAELRFEAELHRLEGELRLQRNQPDAAERCFRRAIALARQQGARWWELRAQVSLARLCREQRRRAAVCRALAPIVGSFTEGISTADVREGRQLLAELSRPPCRQRIEPAGRRSRKKKP